ncbi:MAG: hypothetical protein PHN37_01815 [Candidatus Pacebacteria bacterium]|nr:hypothetical protein [Candidatus Paceibacterota bacterium]
MMTLLSNGFVAISSGIVAIVIFMIAGFKRKTLNSTDPLVLTNALFLLGIIFLFLSCVISMNYGKGKPAIDSFASVRLPAYSVFETLRVIWVADNTYIVVLQSPDNQVYIYKMKEPPPKFFKVQPQGRRYQEITLRER